MRPTTLQQRQLLFRDALAVIEAARPTNLTPDAIASEIATSSRQLQRVFGQLAGVALRRFLLGERMRRAATLIDGGASIAEVAGELGYSHSAHFSRAFKNFYGLAPAHWAEDLRRADALRVIERFYAALQRHDIVAIYTLLAEDVTWSVPGALVGGHDLARRSDIVAWLAVPPPTSYTMHVDQVAGGAPGTAVVHGRHEHARDDDRLVLSFAHEVTFTRLGIAGLDERLDRSASAARDALSLLASD